MNTITKPPNMFFPDTNAAMVLLIDDQAMIGEAIRRILLDKPDIDFHFCSDPAEALVVAEQIRPTVILQDLVMPSMDGLAMVQRFRSQAVTRNVPIIVLSTREDPKVKAEAFAAGANDYLVKLPDEIELVARLRYHSKAYLALIQRDQAFQALHKSQQQLMEMNIQLQRLMNMDGLTGLNNRRHFDEYATVEWFRAIREKSTLSILMIDVDQFKNYNDTYGHLAGDDALKSIAQAIQQSVHRPADLAARFGGEEFVVILPSTPLAGAQLVGENIRRSIEELHIPHTGSSVADHATVSVGGAFRIPTADDSLVALIGSADSALYEAKKQGRNRAIIL